MTSASLDRTMPCFSYYGPIPNLLQPFVNSMIRRSMFSVRRKGALAMFMLQKVLMIRGHYLLPYNQMEFILNEEYICNQDSWESHIKLKGTNQIKQTGPFLQITKLQKNGMGQDVYSSRGNVNKEFFTPTFYDSAQ